MLKQNTNMSPITVDPGCEIGFGAAIDRHTKVGKNPLQVPSVFARGHDVNELTQVQLQDESLCNLAQLSQPSGITPSFDDFSIVDKGISNSSTGFSNLSLRDMFHAHAEDDHQIEHTRQFEFDEPNQREYFDQDGDIRGHELQSSLVSSSPKNQQRQHRGTPPPSLIVSRIIPKSDDPSWIGSSGDQSESAKMEDKQSHTVLYSAIGSLEDPSNGSYLFLNSRTVVDSTSKGTYTSAQLFIPPKSRCKNSPYDDATTPAISNQRKKPPSSSQLESSTVISDRDNSTVSLALQPVTIPIIADSVKQGRNQTYFKDSSLERGVSTKKVTISSDTKFRKSKKRSQIVEMFRPSSDAYTPRMGKKEIKFKPAEMRTPVQQMASPLGTISRPNFRDALRRVSMIIRQHIVKIERRFEQNYEKIHRDSTTNRNQPITSQTHLKQRREVDGLFHLSMKDEFSEDRFVTPTYKLTMVRVPMARTGMVCGLKQMRIRYEIPSENEIYEFAHQLFKKVQLSSECSIVCLIYVERLMEASKVPLLANTWRPIFMCGLLLASKVWQDLSSWNIEFASVYPQYSLDAINRLELQFLRSIKWELYISSSLYAKYYFALRSLVEKTDFRQRYNRMVGGVNNVKASTALKIEERTTLIKEEVLQQLSRSM